MKRPLAELGDWMFSIVGKTYGGYSVQAQRQQMTEDQRQAHDQAWGLNFGNPQEVFVVYQQTENPDALVEHPMSLNMKDQVREMLAQHPKELTHVNADGLTILHREAIAGNQSVIEVLLSMGADPAVRSQRGKTAHQYAQAMGWQHLQGLG